MAGCTVSGRPNFLMSQLRRYSLALLLPLNVQLQPPSDILSVTITSKSTHSVPRRIFGVVIANTKLCYIIQAQPPVILMSLLPPNVRHLPRLQTILILTIVAMATKILHHLPLQTILIVTIVATKRHITYSSRQY